MKRLIASQSSGYHSADAYMKRHPEYNRKPDKDMPKLNSAVEAKLNQLLKKYGKCSVFVSDWRDHLCTKMHSPIGICKQFKDGRIVIEMKIPLSDVDNMDMESKAEHVAKLLYKECIAEVKRINSQFIECMKILNEVVGIAEERIGSSRFNCEIVSRLGVLPKQDIFFSVHTTVKLGKDTISTDGKNTPLSDDFILDESIDSLVDYIFRPIFRKVARFEKANATPV